MEQSEWMLLFSVVLAWIVAFYFWNRYRVLSGEIRKIVQEIDDTEKADGENSII